MEVPDLKSRAVVEAWGLALGLKDLQLEGSHVSLEISGEG